MKKSQIYNIGKDFWISNNNIDNIIINIIELTKTQLFLIDEIEDKYLQSITKDFERFKNWESIEYIINKANFYSLDFYVDNRVLIPRNPTEILVDKALESIINYENLTLIDVWTWSSCIAISILKNTDKIKYSYVLDISEKALEVSEINLKKYFLENKITQIKSNLLQKILGETDYKISDNIIITANLPYIKDKDFKNIDKNTLKYEPKIALFWWEKTWFEIYENLIHQCLILKKQNPFKKIILFIEIWFDQFEYSKNYLKNLWLNWNYYNDNNWINRCLRIKF
jgi:release factor glutamine methyltransferase